MSRDMKIIKGTKMKVTSKSGIKECKVMMVGNRRFFWPQAMEILQVSGY